MLSEHDSKDTFAQFIAPMADYGVTMASLFRPTVTEQYPREPVRAVSRFHGRHQLSRHDDGLEKCVGYELCAWVCPANAIFVKAVPGTPEEQYSTSEHYGRAYQINYLRCILCDMYIRACSARALMMTNDFEIVKYTRKDDIYEKEDLLIPLSDGVLATSHPMVEGKNDIDYCHGEVTGPTAAQVGWVASRRPDDPPPRTVRVAREVH